MRKIATGVGLGLTGLIWAAGTAQADPKDYRFEVTERRLVLSPASPITVTLVNAKTHAPVAGAILFQSRLDMTMPGMGPMATRLTALPPDGKGTYPFVADVAMDGEWVLTLAAKIQGEAGTVAATLPLTTGAEAAPAHRH